MSNEISKQDKPAKSQADGMLSIIERAVTNPEIDVEKLERLIEVQERIMFKQAEIEFNEAMARLQPKLPFIKKTKKSHNSKYAPYEEIERVLRPIYTDEGFSLSFSSKLNGDGTTTYYGFLRHSAGHLEQAEMVLPDDSSGSKNAIQAKGSTMSYAKRYLVGQLLNVVTEDEDDDGQAGGAKLITEDQAKELKKLLEQTDSDVKKFLAYCGNAPSVDEMSANYFDRAKEMLGRKAAK